MAIKNQGAKKGFFKKRLCVAQSLSEKYLNDKFSDTMTIAASLFTKLQLLKTKKKNKCHEFTVDEKKMLVYLYINIAQRAIVCCQ